MRAWFRNNQPAQEKGYPTQLLGSDAVKYINQQSAAKPFYLYLTCNAPLLRAARFGFRFLRSS